MLFPRYSKILAKNIEISLEEDSFILIATDCHAKWGGIANQLLDQFCVILELFSMNAAFQEKLSFNSQR